jgi:hypothetical protein
LDPPTPWPADKIERRTVAALIPYARNARRHRPSQIAEIAASIREWGWTVPILIDESDPNCPILLKKSSASTLRAKFETIWTYNLVIRCDAR